MPLTWLDTRPVGFHAVETAAAPILMTKLTHDQIDEYFRDHLPYRVGILLAHYKMTRPSQTAGHAFLNPCFEASVVTGRLFLNVLGIFKKSNPEELFNKKYQDYKDDDVNAVDLNGKFVDVTTLSDTDKKLFVGFIRMADKACAHLTTPAQHDWEDTHEAIRRICHYLRTHLYTPARKSDPKIDDFLDGLQTVVLHNPFGTGVTETTAIAL